MLRHFQSQNSKLFTIYVYTNIICSLFVDTQNLKTQHLLNDCAYHLSTLQFLQSTFPIIQQTCTVYPLNHQRLNPLAPSLTKENIEVQHTGI